MSDRKLYWYETLTVVFVIGVILTLITIPFIADYKKSEKELAQSVQIELKEHYGDQINIWIDKDNRLCFNFTEGRPFVYVFEVKEFYKLHEP